MTPFHIKEVPGTAWEQFLLRQAYTPFVQAPEYGAFYQMMGEQSWIFGIFDGETLVGGALVVSTHAKRGRFLYIPYGPILPETQTAEALHAFTYHLKRIAKERRFHFVRVSPFLAENTKNKNLFAQAGYRKAPMHVLAETTWLLDIRPSEETLFANMKKNHRNLIRRCERDGVTVTKSSDAQAVHDVIETLKKTAKRHQFVAFSEPYVRNEFEAFADKGAALVFRAYLPDGTLDAASIILFYGSMAVYRHSGSFNVDKRYPTSYLIQWRAVQEAKKRGMSWYNFWGIAPEHATASHPFHGITHFKKGFGGTQLDLLSCQDLPVSPLYSITAAIEYVRKLKRGF